MTGSSNKKRGRPSAYKPEMAKQAEKLCKLGATNAELADFFEVSERSIERWGCEKEEFRRALRAGKEPADDRVEMALYHRAVGYSHPDTDIRVIEGQIVKTEITKHYPPDTKAALAWLYNRRKDKWSPAPEGAQGSDIADVLSKLIDKLPQ